MTFDHVIGELDDLADGRLSEAARVRVADHLSSCPDCRGEYERLQRLRAALRMTRERATTPADVRARVIAALDEEDRLGVEPRPRGVPWSRRRVAVLVGTAAAAAVGIWIVRPSPPDVVREATDTYIRYQAGAIPLEIESSDAATIQQFLERRVDIPPRVFDLGMMGYTLAGGRVHQIAGGRSAFFVYRRDGRVLVCQMFRGRIADLPEGADEREQGGIRFRVYREQNVTLVFWDEGEVTCVLVSDLPTDEVVQLAFAKAMKPVVR